MLIRTRKPLSTAFSRSHGLATAEWLVATFAVIATISLAIEISHWFLLRQHLMLHAQRAVEHAAMVGGKPEDVYQHLTRHLRPATLTPGYVCVLDAVDDLMKDFKDPALSRHHGRALIRHNHLAQQHKRSLAKGWPEGKGPRSHKTISQANVLNVRVLARRPIVLGWVRAVVGSHLELGLTVSAIMQSSRENPENPCVGF